MERLEARTLLATFAVTNINDSGAGSLREAIFQANDRPDADTINFNIPGSGVKTITLTSYPLPGLDYPVTINGWSQPGFTNKPLIQISGGATEGDYGFTIYASNTHIRGLILNGFVDGLIGVFGSNASVQGCYLGTNAAGTAVVGSTAIAGVVLSGTSNSVIGVDGNGANDAREGNLIAGGQQAGVYVGSNTTNNRIAGNRIGLSSSGVKLPNEIGVYLDHFSSSTRVGSNNDNVSDNLEANVISGNRGNGIAVTGTSAGNRFSRNAVYGNGGVEIDLGSDGVDSNDNFDSDGGSNLLTNYPDLRRVTVSGGNVTVGGALKAKASTAYRLEFFAGPEDISGHGGGQLYLGSHSVTTNASGVATFSKSFAAALNYGWVLSSTATDPAGNTSEFSASLWQGGYLDKTFQLHSHPSATKVIYLDFNGHTMTGTQWNSEYFRPSITVPAYNVDGISGLSDKELNNIQRIFHSIAEDFRPFNVNVTTQEPSAEDLRNSGGGDVRWGVRAAIGGTQGSVLGTGSSGGLAFLGSFGNGTPALVFSDALGGEIQAVATATSHEVGHALNLEHDGRSSQEYYDGHGTGATSWGSLMGTPYGRGLSQWSKGQYNGATNTEDDLAIITTQNGFGYRNDDYGNATSNAANLDAQSNNVLRTGIIERNTDVDVLKFTILNGTIDLAFAPDRFDPNLDIKAELLNASGTVIATSNPTNDVAAKIVKSVAAGTYYLRISGVGVGSPNAAPPSGYTDYGSLGFYAIHGTIPKNIAPTITLSGSVGYTRNSATAVVLGPNATVTDPNSANFASGALTVRITTGAGGGNRVIFTGGSFALSGNNVLYNGVTIGTQTHNGVGTAQLRIAFNANATKGIVQLLVRNIKFKTVGATQNGPRVVTFSVTDGDGGTSNTAAKTVNVTG